jgi:alkylation response protein AidB-like acyl-CoA dehydrogenase
VSTVGFVAAMEAIGHADQSIAAAWQAHLTIGSLPLLRFGTDAQKERWLKPLAEGQVLGAFGLTEPGAGSDAAGIRTRAEQVDGGWVLNGQKAFISNAGTDMSFGVTVLARTGDDAEGRGRFGSFVVERDTPGYTWGAKMRGIGWRALDTRELFFDDVFVPDDNVLGDPFGGLPQFLGTLDVGRISIAALSTSLAQAVFDLALDYAKTREQFGQPISKFQAIQFKLADMETKTAAARELLYKACAMADRNEPGLAKHSSMAKLFASDTAMWVTVEAIQVLGGYGYVSEYPVERMMRDAKITQIYEGTNEIQRLVIARTLR